MDYALGAAFFYAWSVTCARRSSAHHGPDLANLGRLLVALVIVGLFVAFSGRHPFSAGWGWLLLGGVLGLGVGDIALFHALPRIGVGLTMLLTQCLAAPIALFLEYEILGLSPNGPQLLGIVYDAIRFCAVASELGVVGYLRGPSAWTQKTPPVQMKTSDSKFECDALARRVITPTVNMQLRENNPNPDDLDWTFQKSTSDYE